MKSVSILRNRFFFSMVIFYVVHLAILPLLFALPLPGRSFFLTKGVFPLCLISFLPADYPQVLPYKKPPHPFPDAATCRSLIKFYPIPASDCRNINHNAEICLSCPHSGLPAKSPGQPASALRRVFFTCRTCRRSRGCRSRARVRARVHGGRRQRRRRIAAYRLGTPARHRRHRR